MAVFLWRRGWNWGKGKLQIQSSNQNLTLTGASTTTTGAFPDGAIPLGVTVRVTTVVVGAGGATDFQVGDGTDVDRWGTAIPFTLDAKTSSASFTSGAVGNAAAGASEVVITPNAGTFSSGVLSITAWYYTLSHP